MARRIRSSTDLHSVTGFRESVDPQQSPLKRIITHYHLSDETACGLKSCRQPHREGFLVELIGGGCTNVGHVCGRQFGERFATEHRLYAEREIRPKAIALLQETMQRIKAQLQEFDQLEAAAEKISKRKISLREIYPKLYDDLKRRGANARAAVFSTRERSQEEIQELRALNPSGPSPSPFEEVHEGTLEGLRCLVTTYGDEIKGALTGRARALLQIEASQLPLDILLEWERWCLHLDDSLERANSLIKEGARFFSDSNLKLLKWIPASSGDRRSIASLTVTLLDKHHKVEALKEAGLGGFPKRKRSRAERRALAAGKRLQR